MIKKTPQKEQKKEIPNKDVKKPKLNWIKIKCACGNEINTLSTSDKDLKVEICSNCHPLYTGTQKLVDSTGQVEKFKERLKKSQDLQKKHSKKN